MNPESNKKIVVVDDEVDLAEAVGLAVGDIAGIEPMVIAGSFDPNDPRFDGADLIIVGLGEHANPTIKTRDTALAQRLDGAVHENTAVVFLSAMADLPGRLLPVVGEMVGRRRNTWLLPKPFELDVLEEVVTTALSQPVASRRLGGPVSGPLSVAKQ